MAQLAAEEAKLKESRERSEREAEEEERARLKAEKAARKRAQRELEEKQRAKAEKARLKEEKRLKEEQRLKDEKRKMREKRKAEELEEERRRAKKRKLEVEEKERRKAEKRRLEKIAEKKAKIKREQVVVKQEIKQEPDLFGDSSDDDDAPAPPPPQPVIKSEPPDLFGSDDDDDDSDTGTQAPYIKNEPMSPPRMAPPTQLPPPTQKDKSPKKKKKDEIVVKLAEKSKKRKKEEKMKKKTNLTIKKEIDTDQFSFDALMTMNTAKVKKKKKIKVGGDELDTSVLEFKNGSSSSKGKKLKPSKASIPTMSDELTDADAAKLATQRKRTSQYSMIGAQKKRFVPKVYSLYQLSEKALKNNAEYLLCRHDFPYPAEIIMPAMERLNEKYLHRLETMQPHLMEDTNHIWRSLCNLKFGKRSVEASEGTGETWKESFTRLSNENEAKLKLLTQKITKKKAKEDSKSLNTKIAFATGYVKPPRGVRAKQLRYGTGNDIRNKRYDVHIPGVTNVNERYTESRLGERRQKAQIANRVNIASDAQRTLHRNSQATASTPTSTGKKTGPLMLKALRGLKTFRK